MTLVRLVVFGQALPQSVAAKTGAGFSLDWALNAGLPYASAYLSQPWAVAGGVLLVVSLAASRLRNPRRGQIFLLAFGLLNLAVVVASRGDWIEQGRLLVSVTAALVALGWTVVPRATPRSVLVAGAAVLISLQSFTLYALARGIDGNNGSMFADRWHPNLVGSSGPAPETETFFNEWNGVHLPNSYFIEAITPTVAAAIAAKGATPANPVTIGSGDAGMNMYYLHQEFGNLVRLLDQWQLVGTDFAHCPGLETTSAGRYVDFEFWSANEGACAPPLPDLIIDRDAVPSVLAGRYTIAVEVSGSVSRLRGQRDFLQQLAISNRLRDSISSEDSISGA